MSLEAIEKKIREDGKAEAERIEAEAEAERRKRLEEEKQKLESQLAGRQKRLKKRMEDRRQRLAAHERRGAEQRIQNARRDLIDGAIDAAVDRLASLGDGEYRKLLGHLLDTCTLSGEVEVLVAEADRERVTADFLKEHSTDERSFVLADESHSGRGGLVFRSGKISQNATFDMIAGLAHDELVMQLSAEVPLESG
ncbi:MAG: V-type ATP synthase subunit E [Candidatus Fermentibacteraceae bacterium]